MHTFRTGSHVLNSKTSSPRVTASYWFLLIGSVILSIQSVSLFLSSLAFLSPSPLVIQVKLWSEDKYDCSASSVLWRHTSYLAHLYMTDFSSVSVPLLSSTLCPSFYPHILVLHLQTLIVFIAFLASHHPWPLLAVIFSAMTSCYRRTTEACFGHPAVLTHKNSKSEVLSKGSSSKRSLHAL